MNVIFNSIYKFGHFCNADKCKQMQGSSLPLCANARVFNQGSVDPLLSVKILQEVVENVYFIDHTHFFKKCI